MGLLQKRISELEKQAITQWKSSQISPSAILAIVEEMRKEFPFDYVDKSESLEYAELHLTIKDPRVRKWFEKWLGNPEG